MDSLLTLERSGTVAGAIAILIFLYFLLRILMRNSSKKRRFPPQPGGAWPLLGHLPLLRGDEPPQVTLGNMADKYGPIFTVKFGVQRSLIVSSWELAKECLTTNDRVFANRPNFLASEILGYNYAMLGLSPYGSYWRQIRKVVTLELLSNKRIQMFKHVRESEVQAAIEGIHHLCNRNRTTSGPSGNALVAMVEWFGDVTMNVIFRIIFGKPFSDYAAMKDDGGDSGGGNWREAVRKYFELLGKFVVSDALPFLRWLDLGGDEKAMKKTVMELDVFVQNWLNEHKSKRIKPGKLKAEEDFMDVMLSILDNGEEMPSHDADRIIKATCLALVLAATDTTKVSLAWALTSLLKNPETLKKAQQELDIRVGKDRQVQESDLRDLVYLQAITKETLRLHPSAPLSVPHESMEDCTVGGYQIPKGTRLQINLWKMHRDPRVWSDPCEFRPERFLTTHQDIDVRGQNFEFLPFGSGRRMCPGISFALPIMQLTLASLLHAFKISTPSGKSTGLDESFGVTNYRAAELEVILTPRLPTPLYAKFIA